MYHSFLIHSSVDGHLSYSYDFRIMVQNQMFRIQFKTIKMSLEQSGSTLAVSAESQANLEANDVIEEAS